MTFGEVGETEMQITTGYASVAHGVGETDDIGVLERMVQLPSQLWTTTVTTDPTLYKVDVDKFLREFGRNARVLSQYHYYRSDIEITIRLVSNQFYYGSLIATLYPSNATGLRLDERMVLDPTELPAASDQAVIKTWTYSWPMAWKRLDGAIVDEFPTWLVIDKVAPLTRAKESMPDNITVLIWARFKNMKLSYPMQPRVLGEAQSQSFTITAVPQVKAPAKPPKKHPADDKSAQITGLKSIDKALDAITSVTMGDAVKGAAKLGSKVVETVFDMIPYAFFFDKPDRMVPQKPMIIEPSIDLFNTDIADSNVSVGVYAGRYCDPGIGRMPMTKNWSISGYSQIPGLRRPYMTFVNKNDLFDQALLVRHPDPTTMKIPLDYAWLNSCVWRGSIKVYYQFRTSGFNAARFSVSYINNTEYPGAYPTDYSNGLSKIINVKGDTNDSFTLPWLSSGWWSEDSIPQIRLKLETAIATQDSTLDPKIYVLMWVAGGEDIQFAFPRYPLSTEWNGTPDFGLRKLKEKGEAQSALGGIFQQSFPPIVENCHSDLDFGFCTFENLGAITDLCKRYSPIGSEDLEGATGFDANMLDRNYDPTDTIYDPEVNNFRETFFGCWRHAFLFRSGGYRFRHYVDKATTHSYEIYNSVGGRPIHGTLFRTAMDNMARLTVPQLANYPFAVLGDPIQRLSIALVAGSAEPEPLINPRYLAARDDVQFGYPILPSGLRPLS